MPIIVCECRTGLAAEVKAKIATGITDVVLDIIKSPLDLISVVFHENSAENNYRSGKPGSDTLILCHIRDGRSDGAILALAKGCSTVWNACTGLSEDNIEVAVATYPARYVVRGGERLEEAPRV